MDLFFYGMLWYMLLLKIVLGDWFEVIMLYNVVLSGYQVCVIVGEDFLMIVEMDGCVEGFLCVGLLEEDVVWLNYYEGGFNYELCDVIVDIVIGLLVV